MIMYARVYIEPARGHLLVGFSLLEQEVVEGGVVEVDVGVFSAGDLSADANLVITRSVSSRATNSEESTNVQWQSGSVLVSLPFLWGAKKIYVLLGEASRESCWGRLSESGC